MSASDNIHCFAAAWLVKYEACLHFWMGHLDLILVPEVDVFEQLAFATGQFGFLCFRWKWLSFQSNICMGGF